MLKKSAKNCKFLIQAISKFLAFFLEILSYFLKFLLYQMIWVTYRSKKVTKFQSALVPKFSWANALNLQVHFYLQYELGTSPNSSIMELNPLQIFLRSLYYIAKAFNSNLGSFFGSIIHLPKLLFAHKIWWSINMFVAVNPLGQKGHFFYFFVDFNITRQKLVLGLGLYFPQKNTKY